MGFRRPHSQVLCPAPALALPLPWPRSCPGHTPTPTQSQPPAAGWLGSHLQARILLIGDLWEWWVGTRLGGRAPGEGALRSCFPPSLHTFPLHAERMINVEGGAE